MTDWWGVDYRFTEYMDWDWKQQRLHDFMCILISVNYLTSRECLQVHVSAIALVWEDKGFHLNTNTHANTLLTLLNLSAFFLGSSRRNLRGISELAIEENGYS